MKVKIKLRTLALSVLFLLLALNAVGDFIKQTAIAKVAKIYGEDARRRASALNSFNGFIAKRNRARKINKSK